MSQRPGAPTRSAPKPPGNGPPPVPTSTPQPHTPSAVNFHMQQSSVSSSPQHGPTQSGDFSSGSAASSPTNAQAESDSSSNSSASGVRAAIQQMEQASITPKQGPFVPEGAVKMLRPAGTAAAAAAAAAGGPPPVIPARPTAAAVAAASSPVPPPLPSTPTAASASPSPASPSSASAAASSSSSAAASAASAAANAAAVTATIVQRNELARQELTRVVKQGYLKKLGAKVKSWKSRYFKLVGYVLTYHESREVQTPVLGEVHLVGTLVKAEPDSMFGVPFTFSVTQTQAQCRTYYCVAADKEEMEEWVWLLRQRHSFTPQGLPLTLNPRVHINMNLNPDEKALRDIAVNSQPINSNYISTDANRKENSQSTLKGAVSKKKRRFVLDGFDLDLTYITNRVIAMGFPAEGTESVYRNDMVDVQKFFNQRHEGHYKVYNLCSERKYEHSRFHGRVLEFPFDDHNCPSFEDLPFFCQDVADFLSADEKNVACIHCKAGKGRTGLVIVVFLLYCGEWQTASEALRYYAFARTQNQKGVTIASQIRWVHYWEKYLSLSRDGVGLPPLEALTLKKMVFSKKAPSFDWFVSACHGEAISSKDKENRIKETKGKDGSLEIELLPDAQGNPIWTFLKDFQFEFFKGKFLGGKERIMSFWLHTQFLTLEPPAPGTNTPNYYLKMERMDIDKVSKVKGHPDFTLELFFEPQQTGRKAAEAGAAVALQATYPLLPAAVSSQLQGEQGVMVAAALSMMLEGRKMTRFSLGNKELKQKEIQREDIFLIVRDETPSNAPASATREYVLCWSLDQQSMGLAHAAQQQAPANEQRLRLADVGSLLLGKQAPIWTRNNVATKAAVEDRCLSILSRDSKVELHLEAYSERQLSLWVEGFKWMLEHAGVPKVTDTKMELFPSDPNSASGALPSPASVNRGSASSNVPPSLQPSTPSSHTAPHEPAQLGAPRHTVVSAPVLAEDEDDEDAGDDEDDDGFNMPISPRMGRAESFARPPPIRVPQNKHRRVINVQQKG